jgi:hypothetical protein
MKWTIGNIPRTEYIDLSWFMSLLFLFLKFYPYIICPTSGKGGNIPIWSLVPSHLLEEGPCLELPFSLYSVHHFVPYSRVCLIFVIKVKGKVVPVLNWAPRHEDVSGSGGIATRIPDLGTRWRWVVSFTLRPLYPQGKSPWYPLDRRLCGSQSRSG